jgi:hypothetical protein
MSITIIKKDHAGREVFRYSGQVIARDTTWVQLEALFSFPDRQTAYHTFRRGDRFIEWHYSDRWYNILEMYDVDDDRLKGWYCNVTRPAAFGPDTIRADDLALDMFVAPDGTMTVLDEDEFAALPLDESTREKARQALEEIKRLVEARQPPFQAIMA